MSESRKILCELARIFNHQLGLPNLCHHSESHVVHQWTWNHGLHRALPTVKKLQCMEPPSLSLYILSAALLDGAESVTKRSGSRMPRLSRKTLVIMRHMPNVLWARIIRKLDTFIEDSFMSAPFIVAENRNTASFIGVDHPSIIKITNFAAQTLLWMLLIQSLNGSHSPGL